MSAAATQLLKNNWFNQGPTIRGREIFVTSARTHIFFSFFSPSDILSRRLLYHLLGYGSQLIGYQSYLDSPWFHLSTYPAPYSLHPCIQ